MAQPKILDEDLELEKELDDLMDELEPFSEMDEIPEMTEDDGCE